MKKTANEVLFENLDATHFTTAKQAEADYPIFKRKFTEILGYDKVTDGSVALQKGHQRGALEDELSSVQILIIVLKRIANNPLVNKLNDFFLIYEDKLEKHQLSDFK